MRGQRGYCFSFIMANTYEDGVKFWNRIYIFEFIFLKSKYALLITDFWKEVCITESIIQLAII